jgi:hypothetical protein
MAPRPDDRGARGVLTVVVLIVAALPARVWPSSPEGQVDGYEAGVAQVDPTGPVGRIAGHMGPRRRSWRRGHRRPQASRDLRYGRRRGGHRWAPGGVTSGPIGGLEAARGPAAGSAPQGAPRSGTGSGSDSGGGGRPGR